jgi:hypothetical protein
MILAERRAESEPAAAPTRQRALGADPLPGSRVGALRRSEVVARAWVAFLRGHIRVARRVLEVRVSAFVDPVRCAGR